MEKIIGKRAGKKGTEYHIHWRGYTDKYDSWEPEQNLLDCEELISNFEANLKVRVLGAQPHTVYVHVYNHVMGQASNLDILGLFAQTSDSTFAHAILELS